MEVTIAQLIESLKSKPQNQLVEYVIYKPNGAIVAMNVNGENKSVIKDIATLFKSFVGLTR